MERNRNFHSAAFIKTNEHPRSFECTAAASSDRPITIFHLPTDPPSQLPIRRRFSSFPREWHATGERERAADNLVEYRSAWSAFLSVIASRSTRLSRRLIPRRLSATSPPLKPFLPSLVKNSPLTFFVLVKWSISPGWLIDGSVLVEPELRDSAALPIRCHSFELSVNERSLDSDCSSSTSFREYRFNQGVTV